MSFHLIRELARVCKWGRIASIQNKSSPLTPFPLLRNPLVQVQCSASAANSGLMFYHATGARLRQKPRGKSSVRPAKRDAAELGKLLESSIHRLPSGFGPNDVLDVLQQQKRNADLALEIFYWTAQQRHYKHTHQTYELMINILASAKRTKQMVRLMEDAAAGACIGSVSLFNIIIYHYCELKMLGPAINVYRKMQKLPECKPTLATYNLLLHAFLRRFSNFTVSCVHLRSVRSLYDQMIAAGVSPDINTLNSMIRAFSRANEMDSAIRTFREFEIYGCEPTHHTFNYIIRGLCEKGRIQEAVELYDGMVKKGMFLKRPVYNVFVCSLAMHGRLSEASKILLEMTDRRLTPDFITYRTVVDEHCRRQKEHEALKLLDEVRGRNGFLDETTYRSLVGIFNLTDSHSAFKPLQSK
eukprot:TRINITY_DN25106_c0_g1_i1.p1 TRINITY_DN25106_c0_g1~~TRINITY_DN25106_c0_g1_i1.p1  ORF type:complete len:413 (+),score=33.31 TRINITY_DN25106_c0_g1_i1:213-1451(+)